MKRSPRGSIFFGPHVTRVLQHRADMSLNAARGVKCALELGLPANALTHMMSDTRLAAVSRTPLLVGECGRTHAWDAKSLRASVTEILTRTWPHPVARSDLLELQARRISRFYTELRSLGYRLANIEALSQEHALALLQHWQSNSKAASTIQSDWSVMRMWSAKIGAAQLELLSKHWEAPKARSRRGPPPAVRLADPALLAALAKERDPTHYLIERARIAFGISVADALAIEPGSILRFIDGRRSVPLPVRAAAAVAANTLAVRAVAIELAEFLRIEGRPSLLWAGWELGAGVRRHQNHLAYLRRKHGALP